MKKGFTLIELLAVIVILAVIALIVTPIVTGIIESSKKESYKMSVDGIADAASKKCQASLLTNETIYGVYTVGLDAPGNLSLDINGSLSGSGIVKIDSGCKADIVMTNNKYTVSKINNKLEVSDYQDKVSMGLSKLKVVALGDSLAEGYLAGGGKNGGYNTKIENYLNNIDRLNYFHNVSHEGTVTTQWVQLISTGELHDGYYDISYDYKTDLKNADVVTLSVGGNDAIAVLKNTTSVDDFNSKYSTYLTTLETNIDNVLSLISSNTTGHVIMLGFYDPFTASAYSEYDINLINAFKKFEDEIDKYMEEDTSKYGFSYISGEKLFAGKVNDYVTVKNDVHPTDAGYDIIAESFINYISKY